MDRILFVLEQYYTGNSQNSICVNNICDILKEYFEIDFLSIEYFRPKHSICNADYILSKTRCNQKRLFLRKIIKFFFMPIESLVVVKKLTRKIIERNKRIHYKAIIAVQNPCESTESVFKFKKKNEDIKCILYEIDPASNRYKKPISLFQKYWKIRTKSWEKKIFSTFDHIIHMKSHNKYFQDAFPLLLWKTTFLDIPCLENWTKNIFIKNDNKSLRMIYAGAFYPELREPDFILNVFKELLEINDFNFLCYVNDSYIDYINDFAKKFNLNIFAKKYISKKELDLEILQSDYLISLGNKDSDYLPSKVLTYISTGKPIIHFAFNKDDVAISYLQKYKNAEVIFEENGINEGTKKIIDFLATNPKRMITPTVIEKLFYKNTPKYNAQIFKQIINGDMKNETSY